MHAGCKYKRLGLLVTQISDVLNPATHFAIIYAASNIVHEFRHNLGILAASRVTCILDVIRCVSKLVFDPSEGARENLMSD